MSDTSSARDTEKAVAAGDSKAGPDTSAAYVSEHSPEYERYLELQAEFDGENHRKFIRKGAF